MNTKIKFGLFFLSTLALTLIVALILSPLSYLLYSLMFAAGINFVPLILLAISFGCSLLLTKGFFKVIDIQKRLIMSGITALTVTFCIFQIPTLIQANHSLKAGLPISLEGKQQGMRDYLQKKYSNISFVNGMVYEDRKENAYYSTFFLKNDPSLGIVVTIDEKGKYSDSYLPDFFAARQTMIKTMEETFPDNPFNPYIVFAVTPVRVNAAGVWDGSFGADTVKENSAWTKEDVLTSFLNVATVYRNISIEQFDSDIFRKDMVMYINYYESKNSIDVNKLVKKKYGKHSGLANYHERTFYTDDFENAGAVLKYSVRVPYEKLHELKSPDDVQNYLAVH
ncbi:hypothetical protein ACNQFZ_21290 [Schinkia sp. CFF1]